MGILRLQNVRGGGLSIQDRILHAAPVVCTKQTIGNSRRGCGVSDLEQRQRRHVSLPSRQDQAQGLEIERAEGSRFWTADGKDWLDFESQVYNAHLGHGNSRVIRAIQEQASSCSRAPGSNLSSEGAVG